MNNDELPRQNTCARDNGKESRSKLEIRELAEKACGTGCDSDDQKEAEEPIEGHIEPQERDWENRNAFQVACNRNNPRRHDHRKVNRRKESDPLTNWRAEFVGSQVALGLGND